VTERPGRLRVVKDGWLLPDPIAGVPEVWDDGQGGLLDVALHPDFAENDLVYLSYSSPDDDDDAATAVARGRGGDLIFIGSDAAKHPRPRQTLYSAGKAGLENFQQALSMELEGSGVRAMSIRLGPTVSEFAADWAPGEAEAHIPYWRSFGLQRSGGLLPAEEVARAVAFALGRPEGVLIETLEIQPAAAIGEAEGE